MQPSLFPEVSPFVIALGELGSATVSFETVLNLSFTRFSLVFRAFQALAQNVAPLFNHKMGT